MKEKFLAIGYKLEYNALNPVTRKSNAYAVASPFNGGGWLVFANKAEIEKYLTERAKFLEA